MTVGKVCFHFVQRMVEFAFRLPCGLVLLSGAGMVKNEAVEGGVVHCTWERTGTWERGVVPQDLHTGALVLGSSVRRWYVPGCSPSGPGGGCSWERMKVVLGGDPDLLSGFISSSIVTLMGPSLEVMPNLGH